MGHWACNPTAAIASKDMRVHELISLLQAQEQDALVHVELVDHDPVSGDRAGVSVPIASVESWDEGTPWLERCRLAPVELSLDYARVFGDVGLRTIRLPE